MNSPNPVEQLSKLTEREREVLRLFCDRLKYGTIAERLFIEESTVKAHVGHICMKLDIKRLPVLQRRELLYQVYCPALREAGLVPGPPDDGQEPGSVPDDVMEMVEDLDKDVVPWQPIPVVSIERDPPPPIRDRRGRPMLLMALGALLTILGALLAVGVIYALGGFRGSQGPTMVVVTATPSSGETSAVEVVHKEVTREVPVEVTREVTREVPVQVTSTPESAQSAPTPVVHTRVVEREVTVEVVVTATPLAPTPTPIEPVNTPRDSVLEVGEWWKHDGVWLKLDEVEFSQYGDITVHLWVQNRTGNKLMFEWSVTMNSITLVDNAGHQYRPNRDPGGTMIVENGETLPVRPSMSGSTLYYQDKAFFGADVTEMHLSLADFSRIPYAVWRIPIPK